jgi:hypothetical protein
LGSGTKLNVIAIIAPHVEAIRERFDQAIDPAEKLRIMEDMERLSYEEMCSFLRNTHDTRFIM